MTIVIDLGKTIRKLRDELAKLKDENKQLKDETESLKRIRQNLVDRIVDLKLGG